MTKIEIRKLAQQTIKKGKTQQQTFDEIKESLGKPAEEIANIVKVNKSSIPMYPKSFIRTVFEMSALAIRLLAATNQYEGVNFANVSTLSLNKN